MRRFYISACSGICLVAFLVLPAAATRTAGCSTNDDCNECLASPCSSGWSHDVECMGGICNMLCDCPDADW